MPSLPAAGRRTTGEAGVTELVQGGASSGNTSATAAAGGSLPALPTAATAAAAAAAAAIAGLGTRAAGEGPAPSKPGASHPLTGLSRQKQVRPSCAAASATFAFTGMYRYYNLIRTWKVLLAVVVHFIERNLLADLVDST